MTNGFNITTKNIDKVIKRLEKKEGIIKVWRPKDFDKMGSFIKGNCFKGTKL